jgi:hypothetical protein
MTEAIQSIKKLEFWVSKNLKDDIPIKAELLKHLQLQVQFRELHLSDPKKLNDLYTLQCQLEVEDFINAIRSEKLQHHHQKAIQFAQKAQQNSHLMTARQKKVMSAIINQQRQVV